MKYHLIRLLTDFAALLSGWRVTAYFNGGLVTHNAVSRADALDWARQYGPDTTVCCEHFGNLSFKRIAVSQ